MWYRAKPISQQRTLKWMRSLKKCSTFLVIREKQIKRTEISSYTHQNGYDKKKTSRDSKYILVRMRMWNNQKTPPLQVRVQTCTTTLEFNLEVSQKIDNSSTSQPSHTTPVHIKRCSIISEGHLVNFIHSSFIHNSQKLEQPRCPSAKG